MVPFALPCRSLRSAIAALVLLTACGTPANSTSGGEPTDSVGNGSDLASGGDSAKSDTGLSDGSTDGGAGSTDAGADEMGGDSDGSAGTDASDIAQSGCEFPAKPLPGEPGSTCKTSDECDSGACVDGPAGKICTSSCNACCPTGFKCEAFQTTGGDSVQVCLPKWNAICRPCQTDAECGKVGKDSLCVQYQATGSFCGGACQIDSDCPGDFKCLDAQGEKGAGKQCVRTKGECACSPAAVADGAQTTCKIANAAGTCAGLRKCTLAGLSACPAATPAPESCGNGVDDDCNGATDENGAKGCTQVWSDGDGDKDGKMGSASQCMCTPSGLYTATTATDCDDANKAVNGSAAEVCDGIDNNCDGKTDEGCDDDGDGWCDANMAVVGDPLVCKKGKKDCDDTNAAINPGMQEQCGNFIDDDCDGLTDSGPNVSGCVPFYADNDSDGFGSGDPVCQCAAKGIYAAVKTGDCADSDPNVNPGAKEACGNQKDDDCNGLTDEAGATGCTNFYVDLDSDGFGTATPTCLCAPDASHTALKAGDCNDGALAINPAATETCNGVDDNCNGTADEMGAVGCTTFYVDGDGDTFGNPATGLCLCQKTPFNTTSVGGDCNDDTSAAHPGATEICDGLDNDCDGQTDEADASGCLAFYVDGDGDGWGDSSKSACLCKGNATFKVAKLGDCNDGDAAINPAAKEVCDSKDNNCVNGIDEAGASGCTTFWRDHDADGFGLLGDSSCLCAPGGEYTATKTGDCNDSDKAVNPKATEICDGVDNDCDGATDPVNADGCTLWYVDKDGDGYGTYSAAPKCLCVGIAGYASSDALPDCNDADASVHPGAKEICNGKDDDCDGVKDPKNTSGCVLYYVDQDSDSYGVSGLSQCLCGADGLFSATAKDDCNDGNALVNPGMAEVCNGTDDNCNGQTDEGLIATYYTDNDLDGYGQTASGVSLCGPDGAHKVATGGDCDDTKSGVNPGAAETCNGVDDNCNGLVDDGLPTTTYYTDADLDGYGVGVGSLQCGPGGGFLVTVNGDCNDAQKAINPGAGEICDGMDNNCNGQTDEGLTVTTYYQDVDGDGYGGGAGKSQCGPMNGFTVTLGGDCNDNVKAINPAVSEVCGNSLDDNCNGQVDENCSTPCVAGTIYSFDAKDTTGWTLDPGWAPKAPGIAGGYQLGYFTAGGGYPAAPNGALAAVTLQVPANTATISADISFYNYTSCWIANPFGSGCLFWNYDTSVSETVTIGDASIQYTNSDSPGTYTLTKTYATPPISATTALISVVVQTPNSTGNSKSYYGIDTVRITCAP